MLSNVELDDLAEEVVIELLGELDVAYYSGDNPMVSDAEYDHIRRLALERFPDNQYFQQVGATVRGHKVKLPVVMGSLDQLHDDQELARWGKTLTNEEVVITDKLDGASGILFFKNGKLIQAATRGDGYEGSDVTRHVKRFQDAKVWNPAPGITAVRGEFIILQSDEEAVKAALLAANGREYKNLRAIVNGLLNAEEIPESVIQYLQFIAYDLPGNAITSKFEQLLTLADAAFAVPSMTLITWDELNQAKLDETIVMAKACSPFELDGIVVEVNDPKVRKQLQGDSTDKNPKFAFKWKMLLEDNLAETEVVGVEWKISKNGYIKPTVLVQPVELCGATIRRATGFNAKFIKEHGIGPGAVVKLTRSGDVIPYILEVLKSVEPDMPSDFVWNETGVDVMTVEMTDAQRLGQLLQFFTTLDIDGIREASVRELFNLVEPNSIGDLITDILSLSKDVWVSLLGKNGGKSYDDLQKKLTDVPMWKVMAAWPGFGRGFGTRKAKALCEHMGYDKGFLDTFDPTQRDELLVQTFIQIDGFSDKTAKPVAENMLNFYKFLKANERVIKLASASSPVVTGEYSLAGLKVAFTGFRDKEAEARLIELGAEVHDGVKKDTTHLVAKDISKSSNKLDKARAQGVVVIDPNSLQELLNV